MLKVTVKSLTVILQLRYYYGGLHHSTCMCVGFSCALKYFHGQGGFAQNSDNWKLYSATCRRLDYNCAQN